MIRSSLIHRMAIIALVSLFITPLTLTAQSIGRIQDHGYEGESVVANVYTNPITGYLVFDLFIGEPGLTEIIVTDLLDRSLFYVAEHHSTTGFFTYTWIPDGTLRGVVLYEVIHDGSRRQAGQVNITPP